MEITSNEVTPLSIYLNSALEDSSNSSGNRITFSFKESVEYDQEVVPFITLSQFTAFNTFASISSLQKNNKLKIVNVFYNAQSNLYDYSTFVRTITIPDNRYTANTLLQYLNSVANYQVTVTGVDWYSTSSQQAVLFLGLGYTAPGSFNSSTSVQGFALSPQDSSRMCILNGEYSSTQNPYVKAYINGSSPLYDPYQYAGLYLVEDAETTGCMTALGFSNATNRLPYIPNTPLRGIGWSFEVQTPTTTSMPNYPNAIGINPATSAFTYNLFGPWLLYFCIDGLSTNSKCNDESLDQNNILASIPITSFGSGLISYEPQINQPQALRSIMSFNSFSITIFDEKKNLVDFRGGTWTAKIDFSFKMKASHNFIHSISAQPADPPIQSTGTTVQQREQLKRGNPYGGTSFNKGFLRTTT